MSNKTELKEDVLLYLNERIKGQKNLFKIARKKYDKEKTNWNEKIKDVYEYGLNLLTGIKRDISK